MACIIPFGKNYVLTVVSTMQTITDTRALGAAIRACRKSSGLTQAEAAALCGVGIRFLSEIENGKPTAHIGKVIKVITGLGLALRVAPRADNADTPAPVSGPKLQAYKAAIDRAADALSGEPARRPGNFGSRNGPTAAEQVAGLKKALFPDD